MENYSAFRSDLKTKKLKNKNFKRLFDETES